MERGEVLLKFSNGAEMCLLYLLSLFTPTVKLYIFYGSRIAEMFPDWIFQFYPDKTHKTASSTLLFLSIAWKQFAYLLIYVTHWAMSYIHYYFNYCILHITYNVNINTFIHNYYRKYALTHKQQAITRQLRMACSKIECPHRAYWVYWSSGS